MDDTGAAAGGSSDRGDDVTASEAAAYVFCAKAWHLEHVLGLLPSDAARRQRGRGTVEHRAHGARVAALHRLAPRLARVSVALLLLASLLAVAALFIAGR